MFKWNYKEDPKRQMYPKAIRILLLSILTTLLFLTSSNAQDVVRVKRVVDGDTLLLTNGERVRLIGVDTPETKHPQKPVQRFGKEAYLFTKRTVEIRKDLNDHRDNTELHVGKKRKKA